MGAAQSKTTSLLFSSPWGEPQAHGDTAEALAAPPWKTLHVSRFPLLSAAAKDGLLKTKL
jgi:hypothetical protein